MRVQTLIAWLSISTVGLLVAGCAGSAYSNPPGRSAPAISVQPANQTVTVGQTAAFTVTATGTPPLSYQWNKNGAAISGATSASYTTPATVSSDNGAQFTVAVSNSLGSVTSAAATLTVTATSAVQITTTSLPAGQTQASYSATLQATGGTPSYTWSVASGQLPAGLTLNASTGTISGTPNTAGTSTFNIQVADSAGNKASAGFTITISAAGGSLTITTSSLPNGTVGAAYVTSLQATGGTTPYTWSVTSGQLPAGLTLASTGSITGTPTTAGSSTFAVQVADNVGNTASATLTITIGTSSTMPQFGHVFIVIGENTGYTVSFNSTNMPYLTSLANKYGISTTYWADTHPSIGNYEALTAGQIFTNDDSQTPSTLPLSSDNIAFEVQQAGKTWKDYVETGGPDASVQGCSALNSGNYIVRHDPLEYFTNINKANIVCFSQFATDLANNALPNLSWLSPNGCDDAHDCPLSTFDNWLQTEIAPLLASTYFQSGGDGLLIITFDEGSGSGSPNCTSNTTTVGLGCGGQVETVLISARSKPGYQSTAGDPANWNTTYDEANILRTIAQALGLNTANLGGAANRVPMADFF